MDLLMFVVLLHMLSRKSLRTARFSFSSFSSAHFLFSLDPERKEELADALETLLGDNTTLVLGPAIVAFTQMCPDNWDLIHPHFRKLCNRLADMDEWNQVYAINMLTRYTRSQFLNPDPDAVRLPFISPSTLHRLFLICRQSTVQEQYGEAAKEEEQFLLGRGIGRIGR